MQILQEQKSARRETRPEKGADSFRRQTGSYMETLLSAGKEIVLYQLQHQQQRDQHENDIIAVHTLSLIAPAGLSSSFCSISQSRHSRNMASRSVAES
ncbi:hypothetical protein SAMN04487965_1767 [Microbulbifer donghaiensis]|uniref:Uncharacterized protein n=1 Tax=Microbulbifer donghaiensis TaxID=494016 RepID=A0A1M5A6S6_9GAMM|nr:hypothetical protein SAMN04487965_1767 [Microbulbifer donghaiensis]